MDTDSRNHPASSGFSDYEYALALHGQPALDEFDDWKLFGQQDSTAMSFHHGADSHHLQTHAVPAAPLPIDNSWCVGPEAFSTAGGLLSLQNVPLQAPTSILPAAPTAPATLAALTGDDEDDAASMCDSDCSGSEICHDSTCSDDPAVCCEDQACLLKDGVLTSADGAITSEDAIAAAALASFVAQNMQPPLQRPQTQKLQTAGQQQKQQRFLTESSALVSLHNHQGQLHHQSLPLSSPPSCMQLGLWPDLCISPQFLTNYQHLREAHDPLQPTSCSASLCPVEDPSFYQECHIRHVSDPPGDLFDNIDLDMLMANHEHYHVGGVECGARFSTGEAMIQHLWNEHRAAQQQWPMEHTPGFVSSVSPSLVSLPSQDQTRSPSFVTPAHEECHLFLPDASVPTCTPKKAMPYLQSMQDMQSVQAVHAVQQQGRVIKEELTSVGVDTEEKALKNECLWCDTVGGQPCGQVFDVPVDLHKHVLAAHTHLLVRDVDGTYSCGWQGCSRHEGSAKSGFAQKSKIERHMQVHTGNKPFTCDICYQCFSANQALSQHKLIHQDSKPLACEICGKTFRQHSALTMHIRTHTKVRPLKCPYCHKEFSESSNLSKHKRIHAGDGQYECHFPGCKRTFHRRDQLRRHSALHNRDTHTSAPATSPTCVVAPAS